MVNPIEMGNENHDVVVQKLSDIRGYAKHFKEAFGTEEISIERVTKAIADYERTRMGGNSPWDKWRKGGDRNAVSQEVKKGHELFFGSAFCNNCHLGQNFNDGKFHNLGIGWDPEAKKFADEGRYQVTKMDADRGAFKTPSLRDVSKHAPYMHDGSLRTLPEVVAFYDRGGHPHPGIDPRIRALHLSQIERDSLVAFLNSLTGDNAEELVRDARSEKIGNPQ